MKKQLLNLALLALPVFGFGQYCVPTINFNCTDGDVIQNVTFAGINNNSQCGNSTTGYSDYSSSVSAAQVSANAPYTVSVKVGPSGDGWLYESVGVWIDYNQNGVFDSDEYTYVGTGLNEVLSKEILIPVSAIPGNTRMRVVVAAAIETAFGHQFACGPVAANNPYGEMEDYTVTVTGGTACTGAPTISSVGSSASNVCVGQSFTLSASATPVSAYSYQWQLSTDGGGNWNNLGTAQNTSSYSISSQSQTTQYRVIVTCTETSQSTTSGVVTVTQNAPTQCYCGPLTFIDSFFGDDGDEPITSVKFAGIDNQTDATPYQGVYHEFFLDKKATVMQGDSPVITLKGNTAGDYTNKFVVFIDWNQNGKLDDAGEVYEVATPLVNSTGTDEKEVTRTINVPSDATIGETRMRVKKIYGTTDPNFLNPCSGSDYGQAEDYTVIVTQAAVCSGAPTIDSVSASVANVCAGVSFSLSATASPQAIYSYQWQSSTDGGGNWNNLGTAQSSSNYSVASQTQTTQYRVIVTCTATSTSTTSNAVTVTQNAPTQCYCTANATSTLFEKISNVTLSLDGTDVINNNSTATAGYEDFTSVTGNVTAGKTYSFSASFTGTSYAADQVIVWIDLNGNGSFDDSGEQVLMTNTSLSPWTGSITIPAGTTPITTRMRVRLDDTSSSSSNTTPCGTSTFGQVEDYTLNIGALAVADVSKLNVKSYPNPVKDIFNIEAQGKIKSVKVFDAVGKQLLTKDLNEAKSQIDFSKLAAGVYIVTTQLEDGTSTSTKVIKK